MVPSSLDKHELLTAVQSPAVFSAPDNRLGDEAGRLAALGRYSRPNGAGDPTFDAIANMICTICEVPSAAIALIDADRIRYLAKPGFDGGDSPRDIGFCTRTIEGRGALIVADAREDVYFSRNPLVVAPPHVVSYLGVPLMSPDGYNVGAVYAVDYRPRQFGASQVEALHKLAAMTIDQLEWQQIELRDPLTRALSRRAFLSAADNLIWQRDWCSLPASLVVFDVDGFRALNVQHGHAAGDVVLRKIVRSSMASEHDEDVLARVGGDRFALLRIGEVGSRAFATAEAMRASIAALRFDELPGVSVTASFGVAEINAMNHDAAAWLAEAQHWLLSAKRSGGDRCGIDPRSLPRA